MSPPETQIDVLAVFSHPDDAELSVAGTLLKLKALGYRTGVCDFTRGEMGTRGTPEIRAKEALDAARIMKLDVRLNLDQPDGHVWPTEDCAHRVCASAANAQAKGAVNHARGRSTSRSRKHVDHRATSSTTRFDGTLRRGIWSSARANARDHAFAVFETHRSFVCGGRV